MTNRPVSRAAAASDGKAGTSHRLTPLSSEKQELLDRLDALEVLSLWKLELQARPQETYFPIRRQ